MLITFDGQDLFSSGPTRVHVGGASLRHARERPLTTRGEHVFSQGVNSRTITQTGTLVADTEQALHKQIEAIEAKLDGIAHPLVDDQQRTWPNVIMTAFEPATILPLGTRWKVDYRIAYVQANPSHA